MQHVNLYTAGPNRLTFRPVADRPTAVVGIPANVTIDPATDEAYVDDIYGPVPWKPTSVYLAGLCRMFGFVVVEDNLARTRVVVNAPTADAKTARRRAVADRPPGYAPGRDIPGKASELDTTRHLFGDVPMPPSRSIHDADPDSRGDFDF